MRNLLLSTDSYKQSHFLQYPPEARAISAYGESRPNSFSDKVVFFGLQPFLIDYLGAPISAEDIEEAAAICAAHGVPFNREGWEAVLADHGGYLPLEISALPEGTVAPTGVPLFQVVNTDDRMPWLTTFIETALLRSVWYPTTVATLSWKCAKVIGAGLEKSSDDPAGQLPFKLHDFGARGVSSGESAALGGMAHLVNFAGTDTLEGIMAARRYYGADMPGFSIPAAEHSTMTAWGRDREEAAYANMLDKFEGEGALVAVVSDSYDLDNAVENIWGGSLKRAVLARKGTLVVRPDSGDPVETPARTLAKLWEIFGGTTNAKGYRVLNDRVRVIQGDGMNIESIGRLVDRVVADGFSVDNIAFGMGGGLLQLVNRDTLRFAMKANAMRDDQGEWHDVSKKPATDPAKASKAGRQAVVIEDGRMVAKRLDAIDPAHDLLKPVWRNGDVLVRHTFEEVRARAKA
ncbi:nicotinate phosphoribosyltransferase [Erythrobacter sp. THAF29]|uniref:nicotinate phosphoribosyltransferase n=1 Tax=Erythrobacter sp. THAF29 TaxID=2587851 RepID=UPI0012694934|nr:nicotinate phosphoribosyltransferase [Erythrobacter sp. THAF29]QFT76201.1 putative nicotinate phosphoribosyltransferase [Erythrobacter sp. THAF29]